MGTGLNEAAAARVVAKYRHAPFDWGTTDCLHFIAEFLDARLDTSYLHRVSMELPFYQDARSAIAVVASFGVGANPIDAWEAAVTHFLGAPCPIGEVEFGDVVLGRASPPQERTVALGICDEEMFMAPGNQGLVWMPMRPNAVRGWKCRKF